MQAIETVYSGYRFRSRLEARWAVFFDTLGIRYEYEKEGFELPHWWQEEGDEPLPVLRYLPDFWLPALGCYFEVKGPTPDDEDEEKAGALAMASGKPVYIFWGECWHPYFRYRDQPSTESGRVFARQELRDFASQDGEGRSCHTL